MGNTMSNMPTPALNTSIQSVAFDLKVWTTKDARQWLKDHGHKPTKRVDTNKTFHRYRLQDPNKFMRIRVKDIGKGIRLLIGFKHNR